MKQEIKICLPVYKIVYSLFFLVILSLIRGITEVREIGVALDANVALLAIVFCADTYVMERSGKRWEVFGLFSVKKKSLVVFRRLAVQNVYLCLLAYVSYFFFYWQRPRDTDGTAVLLYGLTIVAVTATCLFFSTLSMTITNLCRNQWAGLGITVVLWLLINSQAGEKALGAFSIFAFGFRSSSGQGDWSWLWGKAAGILLALCMAGAAPYIMKKRG